MIKDILQQLAPLDEKIAALRGDPADENMTDITNHAAELAELSAQEDALLSGCGALTAEDRVFLARHPERPHIDEIVDALFTDFFEQRGDRQCGPDPSPGKLRALREPGDCHSRHDTQRNRQGRQPQQREQGAEAHRAALCLAQGLAWGLAWGALSASLARSS